MNIDIKNLRNEQKRGPLWSNLAIISLDSKLVSIALTTRQLDSLMAKLQ